MTRPGSFGVQRLRPFGTTIFAEMSELAVRHRAINLGQGFPDADGPESLLAAAKAAIDGGYNQYPPAAGYPALREAISQHIERHHGLAYDPVDEVLVTVGASEALASAILGLVEPGSEVILLEPYYDLYAAAVAMAGATRVAVPLIDVGDRYGIDETALAAAVTDRTALIVVNSPHNPTGSVFDRADLEAIARVAIGRDVLVLTDEVYEHLLFDGVRHLGIASLPGMRERTLRVSSAAKTFNVTGWKIGWVTGPAELVTAARSAKQYLSFAGGGPFQPAVALALDTEDAWIRESCASLAGKRDRLSDALAEAGFDVHPSGGTYFVVADPRPLGYHDGADLCRRMPELVGVAAVPISAFVDHPESWRPLVRFAFAKHDASIDEAAERLRGLRR